MAEPVSMSGKRILVQVCLSWWTLTAVAQTDPTRPPVSISVGRGEVTSLAASPVSGPVLQSVLISSGRKMAIISGQTVKLNQKFGDSRLIHIAETEVILRSGKTEQTLKLFPDIRIRPVIQSVR
jgi:MSHA biogenesis protein MshK